MVDAAKEAASVRALLEIGYEGVVGGTGCKESVAHETERREAGDAFGCLVSVGGDVLAASTGYATYGLVLDVAETSYAALACDCCTEGVDDEGG